MHEQATPLQSRPARLRDQPAGNAPGHGRRRRAALRHEAAVVAAEIRRMRRAGRPEAAGDPAARLAT